MKPVEIFKPGKHTASDGREFNFTEAQVREAVESYNPELHEAPIVIGHPTGSAPAYGWVKGLALDKKGGIVIADPHQVEPQFEEMVKEGRFKKRSAAFYLPDTPGNPTPGKLYLHHVAFLGAKPPAVKGLKDAEFSADATGVVEFSDWFMRDSAGLWRSLRDFFIEQFGLEKTEAFLPSWRIDALQAEAAKEAATGTAAYSEHQQETDVLTQQQLEERERKLAADKAALEAQRAEFAEREKTLRANETAAQLATRRRECAEFVDAQVKEGRVLPAQRDGLVAFMAALPAEGIVEFGEGDKAVKKPSAEWLRGYISAQPKVVEFGERGAGGAERIDTGNAERDGREIGKRAAEFQESERKAGRTVSIDVAVQHVTSQQGAQ